MARGGTVWMKTEGFRDVEKALMGLKAATAKRVGQKALTAGAEPIAADAKARAPQDTGELAQQAGQSAKAKGSDARAAFFRGGAAKDAVVTRYVGPASSDGQGLLQEFGTEHHAPQPWLRPAFEANRVKAVGIILDVMWSEVRKAAARAARRVAKGGR